MTFDEHDDLRGCRVWLRQPGKSCTIPCDATRIVHDSYVTYRYRGGRRVLFQNTSGAAPTDDYDIVDAMQHPHKDQTQFKGEVLGALWTIAAILAYSNGTPWAAAWLAFVAMLHLVHVLCLMLPSR